MSIFKLDPAFKDYIWGGTRLRDEYGKKCDYDKVAESWELSCHKDGPSVVADGEYKGLTLNEYIEKAGKGVLGKNCERFENFPILIKLIDAKDNLSVQVHPDNDYAMRVEGEYGKTEMWYVVDCDEGATLLYGFKHEITKEERENLVKIIKNLPVHISGTRGYNEAIITKGGISIKEINPKTMESKIMPNIYFVGEVLDLDAMTGGYNLQIAWSTGYLAGNSIY